MKIQAWNNTFTEDNHIQSNPKILTEYIRTHEHKNAVLKTKKVKDIIITNKEFTDLSIVVLGDVWLKESEYKLWVKAFKNIEIDPKKEVELIYFEVLSNGNVLSYKGTINFK